MKSIRLIIIMFMFFSFLQWGNCAENSDMASSFLCEYGIRLYNEGNVNDAVQQLKQALMANPYNLNAKNYLTRIMSGGQSPHPAPPAEKKISRIDELSGQLAQLQEERRAYQKQLSALQDASLHKDNQLVELTRQLERQKELLQENEENLESALQDKEKEINGLRSQLPQLEKKRRACQGEIDARGSEYAAELARKDKSLKSLNTDYQKQLVGINNAIKTKEEKIARLMDEKKSLVAENKRIEQEHMVEIEKLTGEVAAALVEAGERLDYKGPPSARNRIMKKIQTARIDKLMREIEGILAK